MKEKDSDYVIIPVAWLMQLQALQLKNIGKGKQEQTYGEDIF